MRLVLAMPRAAAVLLMLVWPKKAVTACVRVLSEFCIIRVSTVCSAEKMGPVGEGRAIEARAAVLLERR